MQKNILLFAFLVNMICVDKCFGGPYDRITYVIIKAGYDYYKKHNNTQPVQEASSNRNTVTFTGSKKSDQLIAEARYEEKEAEHCFYMADGCMNNNNIYGYNSWSRDAKEHLQKANKRRSDAEYYKRYGN
jgi:hypothetical protein